MFKAAEDHVDVIIISLGLASYDALRLCSQIRALERTRNLPILADRRSSRIARACCAASNSASTIG